MSWNKETFKEKWKEKEYTKFWLKEWEDEAPRYQTEFNRILTVIKKIEWKSLVEIDCGMGKNIFFINREFKRKNLKGYDINKEFLEVARDNKIDVAEQDTENLKIDKVDVILDRKSVV